MTKPTFVRINDGPMQFDDTAPDVFFVLATVATMLTGPTCLNINDEPFNVLEGEFYVCIHPTDGTLSGFVRCMSGGMVKDGTTPTFMAVTRREVPDFDESYQETIYADNKRWIPPVAVQLELNIDWGSRSIYTGAVSTALLKEAAADVAQRRVAFYLNGTWIEPREVFSPRTLLVTRDGDVFQFYDLWPQSVFFYTWKEPRYNIPKAQAFFATHPAEETPTAA